jgi:hypothetical protein
LPRHINDHQLRAVSALPAAERYGHFIRQVADWREVWSLRDQSGWALVADDLGRECLPVWPHARYAEAIATDEFATSHPQAIALDAFIDEWLPRLERDGKLLAVFPTKAGRGVVVPAEKLRADLEQESAQYE